MGATKYNNIGRFCKQYITEAIQQGRKRRRNLKFSWDRRDILETTSVALGVLRDDDDDKNT